MACRRTQAEGVTGAITTTSGDDSLLMCLKADRFSFATPELRLSKQSTQICPPCYSLAYYAERIRASLSFLTQQSRLSFCCKRPELRHMFQ